MNDCIFCKIIKGDVASKIIAQSDTLIVIQDLVPQAPIHYLIIPKKHIQDVQRMDTKDLALAGDTFAMAQQLSKTVEGAHDFKLHINSGKHAGQHVMHLHTHFLAGSPAFSE